MLKYSYFKKRIWENSTLSNRIISWILNIDTIINNGTFEFKKNFFENIILQCNHLKKNLKFEKNPLKKIEVLSALILSGIVFKDYENNYNTGIKELEKFVKSYFDEDGYPLTRSSNDLIFLPSTFCCAMKILKMLNSTCLSFCRFNQKTLDCIKFFMTPNKQVPLFNGSSENSLEYFDKYLDDFKIEKKKKITQLVGYILPNLKAKFFILILVLPQVKNFLAITNLDHFHLNILLTEQNNN